MVLLQKAISFKDVLHRAGSQVGGATANNILVYTLFTNTTVSLIMFTRNKCFLVIV